ADRRTDPPPRRRRATGRRHHAAVGARRRRRARHQPDDGLQGVQPAGGRRRARAPARQGHGSGRGRRRAAVAAAALGPARTRPPGARARTFAGRTACPAPPTDGGTRMNAVAQPAVAPAAPLDLSFAMEPPISVRGVDKRYDGQTVLAGADLQLEPGAVLGLIGRNGAGKSTLIRILLGLVEPDAGQAHIWGQRSLMLDDARKARLGYVPQQPEALPWLKVGDMMDFIGRFYPRWDAAFVTATLDRWGLPTNKVLAKLSPGERQRVAIIRALAPRPELLVLDEPAAA